MFKKKDEKEKIIKSASYNYLKPKHLGISSGTLLKSNNENFLLFIYLFLI